ncbi:universal stress protein [Halomicroarcula limicola]|uniref:Universal stress protein n=1 Tax=Haloarcula limicola TaxID=1429915 RepID=A0A8J8C9D2_9EURY|nr:universal stress protein [Halomicroarcula limicola]MBV0925375.1 universal stress protein [Halomicroarcula limicola]
MGHYDTILVPTDGSTHAEEAVEVAFRLAETDDADVHTLFVVDTRLYGEPALSSVELFLNDLEEQGHDVLSELVGRGTERGIDVEREIRHGDPEVTIVEYADEIDADLLVMGYQGHSHQKSRGAVLEGVLDATDRHVLVI